MTQLYVTVLYEPVLNLLVYFYNVLPGNSFGFAIILLTLIVQAVTLPFSIAMLRSQQALQAIQPKVDAVKKKYEGKKEQSARQDMTKEMMAIYKEEKVNPLSSCFVALIQIPFLLAVFQVLRNVTGGAFHEGLYPFVTDPGTINATFLGVFDLASRSIALAIAAAVAQFFQTKMLSRRRPPIQSAG